MQSQSHFAAPAAAGAGETVALARVLDLTQARPLYDRLATSTGAGLALDASAVERMSTPCVQVLIAAGRSFSQAGRPFQIVNGSSAFKEALLELGVAPEFSKWMV